MKKRLALVLCLVLSILLLQCLPALSEMDVIEDVPLESNDINISVTTGMPTGQNQATMVVQMDNEPGARPQKGIGSADIVYEVEIYNGGYTRYTVVFNDQVPEEIEAVRSTRIGNVDLYKEFGGAYVHFGAQYYGGYNAGEYMDRVGVDFHFDGMTYGSGFYRDSARSAPNNVVCKLSKLRDGIDWANYTPRSPLKFSADHYTVQGERADGVDVIYRAGSYEAGFRYVDGRYLRSYNNAPHLDGETGEQLSCANIIVQHVDYSWVNGDSAVPKISIIGRNACDYFIDGMHFTGYSERDNVNTNTRYFDDEGNEVVFKPGKTFIQLLKNGREMRVLDANASAASEIDNTSVLRIGSRGDSVLSLQLKLIEMGLLKGNADGIYGNKTSEAVSAAQAQLGMDQTGVADQDFLNIFFAG